MNEKEVDRRMKKKKNSVPEWAAKGMSFLRVERKKQHMDKGGI